jgi:hypothetical protein
MPICSLTYLAFGSCLATFFLALLISRGITILKNKLYKSLIKILNIGKDSVLNLPVLDTVAVVFFEIKDMFIVKM